jgi:hypothetical protein
MIQFERGNWTLPRHNPRTNNSQINPYLRAAGANDHFGHFMDFFGLVFLFLLSPVAAFAADFDCADARLNDPAITFEQATDAYADAYASADQHCLIAATDKVAEKMFELNDGDPEHFERYISAMRYLGQMSRLSLEAKIEIGSHLEMLYADEGFLAYYLDQEDSIENQSGYYATATLLGLTGLGVTGEWFLRSAFSLALQHSPTRIVRSAGFRGLRRVGIGFLRSPRISNLQPRLLARGASGTAAGNLREAAKKKPILDLQYSPMRLAGLAKLDKTSLSYFTFWETFKQQSLKWTGASAAGFITGVGIGHVAHSFYEETGLTKFATQMVERIEMLRHAAEVIRARQFTTTAAKMAAGAIEPAALLSSTVVTVFALREIELYIEKLKIEEVNVALEELKTKVQAAHDQHHDYNVLIGVNLIVDHVRLLEAIMATQELQNQLEISNQYVKIAATDPICSEIKGQSVDVERARSIALARINHALTYANITAKPKFDQIQKIYDANLKFIDSLKGPDGNSESYLASSLVRLETMKVLSRATLDTPSHIELLQQTAVGLYDEMKQRSATNPQDVAKELSCPMPPDNFSDWQRAIAY